MRFTEGSVAGHWIVDLDPIEDHRGFFARTWCEEEFGAHGMTAKWPQQNMQYSPRPGTMRGLHYQVPPHSEIKLVRCSRGAVYDVALDLRPHSPTYGRWSGTELSADSHRSVWVPEGCAHGYVTLKPDSEVFYLTSAAYEPESVRGVRYDDPQFAIAWPRDIELVPSDYESWPDFDDSRANELASVPLPGGRS
jgi:dTDP-4-dehydrorhamnose 3,5-epimerase